MARKIYPEKWFTRTVDQFLDIWWDIDPESFLRIHSLTKGIGINMIRWLVSEDEDLFNTVMIEVSPW